MKTILIMLSVLMGVFLSASLLSGAGVGASLWYAAPKSLSTLLVSIASGIFITRLIYRVLSYICQKKSAR
ncbi:hypothetical protein FHU10_4553 [Serratia fonticola]|uniref:Uncharacterized protein n=1 Tax=Serratia fonticola TaxID=47917 RepID=A0A542D2U4_SERFO|nr:hypothetical protein [Serratia fonticola]TQI80574.1 hypothetical protein FHU09_3151 [Serratia fonticola]TQI97401.1 hypothetical protein FHU11_2894 [Serratia fonticola]TVZ71897.1 hypothetical protein FHU10_4553 [Serratia fonticola]